MKLEFPRQTFEKSSYIEFNENVFSGRRVVPCERTGRHSDETNIRLSKFLHFLYVFQDTPCLPPYATLSDCYKLSSWRIFTARYDTGL